MIYRAESTDKDLVFLTRQGKSSTPVNFDYKNLVVNKPWGYEYLFFENNFVAIWVLFLKEDQSTSMHCHPNKKTSLLVLSGKVETTTLDKNYQLGELDGLLIDAKAFHSTKSISKGGSVIMEIETPPNKGDLVRLKDIYGREGKGYEGLSELSFELDRYEYCFFDLKNPEERKKVRNKTFIIKKHSNTQDFMDHVQVHKNGVLAILEGELKNTKGEDILVLGDAFHLEDLLQYDKSEMGSNLQVTSLIII